MAFQSDFQSQLKDPKQKRMLVAAGVIFIAAGIFVYRTFFASPAVSPVSPDVQNSADTSARVPAGRGAAVRGIRESDIKRIKLDTDILETDFFRGLTTYSRNIPVKVETGELGNAYAFQKKPVPTASPSPQGSRK